MTASSALPSEPKTYAFIAGEASGDLLSAPVIAELIRLNPLLCCGGIAGDRMAAAGCDPWWHTRELSVRGYAEVLRELPRILALRRSLLNRLLAERPKVVVGVDAPDFNLALEIQVRAAGMPTVHYVSPSIWAWRRERIEKIRAAADHVLLIFPFEKAIYDAAGIPATYVGHPLASAIPQAPDAAAARERLGLHRTGGQVVAILPGSRRSEIQYNAPTFIAAADLMCQDDPAIRFVIPAADSGLHAAILGLLREHPRAESATKVLLGQSHDALEAADAVLVASGTATLEAALFKRPMVIAYKVPRLTWWLMRHRGYLPWIGLPNILSNASVVPEFWQDAVTPEALAKAMRGQLDDHANAEHLNERFSSMHHSLRRDSAVLAAQAIVDTAQRRHVESAPSGAASTRNAASPHG